MHKDWSVQADVDGVATARGYAKYAFAEAGLDARESEILVLLVSELVTNAIVHAEPPFASRSMSQPSAPGLKCPTPWLSFRTYAKQIVTRAAAAASRSWNT